MTEAGKIWTMDRRNFIKTGSLTGGMLLSGAGLTALLDACSTSTPTSGGNGPKNTTMTFAVTDAPQSFDADILAPGSQLAVLQCYEPLVDYAVGSTNSSGARSIDANKLQPRLAEAWTVSSDNLTWTFKLRQGVKSPMGNELTSDDVVWSFDKTRAQKRTGNFILNASNVVSYQALDKYTVQVVLSAANPFFLKAMTLYVPAIFDSTEVKKHVTAADPFAINWIAQNVAGYGPYMVESASFGQQVTLVQNPNYYGKKPFFQKVLLQQVPDPGSRQALISSGQVDLVTDLTYAQSDEVRKSSKARVMEAVSNYQQRCIMNEKYPPFDNQLVRQAINYAVDHKAILANLFGNKGGQMKSPVADVIPGHDGSFWHYETDANKAKQLLAQAGHGSGLDLTLEYSAQNWSDEQFAIQVQNSVKAAGINITLSKITNADMTAKTNLGARTIPFAVYYEQAIVLDPGYVFSLESVPTGAGDRNASNIPQLTALTTQMNKMPDSSARAALVKQAQQIQVEDAGWMYGVEMVWQMALGKGVTGWVWHPDNQPRLADFTRT